MDIKSRTRKTTVKKKKSRIVLFDKLRGVAVLLMLLSHSIDFFYSGNNPIILFIRWFGASFAFTIFMFVSGAVSYIAYIAYSNDKNLWRKKQTRLFKRGIALLTTYYLIAFVGSINTFSFVSLQDTFVQIVKIVALINVPKYSEFIIPFIILSFVTIVFGRTIKKISRNQLFLALFGIGVYVSGAFFYHIDLGNFLNFYKSILFGHLNWYRFPVFQYFPVFLLGLHFGWLKKTNSIRSFVSNISMYIGILAFSLFLIINQSWLFLPGSIQIKITRWPPSISFIVIGLVFILSLLFLFQLYASIYRKGTRKGLLCFLGKHAFSYYIYHILILYSYELFIDKKVETIWVFLLLFSILLCISSLLVTFNTNKSQTFDIIGRIETQIFNRIYQMKKNFKLLAVLVVAGTLLFVNKSYSKQDIHNIDTGEVEGISIGYTDEWWNDGYKNHTQLSIVNNSDSESIKGSSILSFTFDHALLVQESKSTTNASDIKLVYWSNGIFEEIQFGLIRPNSSDTKISFPLYSTLNPKETETDYFLYYNNNSVTDISHKQEEFTATSIDYSITLGAENGGNFTTSISRKWYLIDINKDDPGEEVKYSIQINNTDTYEKNDVKVFLTGTMNEAYNPSEISDNNFELLLSSNDLEPGKYFIQTVIENTPFESQIVEFNVSYPLYVAWTVDWEGFDVTDNYLNSMDNIANTYNIPMTTFFNPRIFISNEVDDQRIERLVKWALDGVEKRGDEIGMHMHMHTDMIEAAGLEPKTSPRWGGRLNGHDVLTTAYNYDEFQQLVEWAIGQFILYKLPLPVSYRAGGWFIDEENLRVLDDLGFLIDSSGREAIIYGPNQITNPWNLLSTTKPYQLSRSNQNLNTGPTLSLWEFPNNGMDSTNNKSDVMIQKFQDNFSGQPLNDFQVVTYLSHPHWFDTYDSGTLKELFDHINPYRYDNDGGPVVFNTLEGSLNKIRN